MVDPQQEAKRLKNLYSTMTNGELIEIARSRLELTEPALTALDGELRGRNIDIAVDATPSEEIVFRKKVTIARFRDLTEALLAKGRLEASGIVAVLLDHNLIGAHWGLSNAIGGVKLQVEAEDVEEAREILEQEVLEAFDEAGEDD